MDLDRSPLTVAAQSRDLITRALKVGTPIRTALEMVGVHRSTWETWRKIGETELARCLREDCDPEPHLAPYVEFVQSSNVARAQGVFELLERVHAASLDPRNYRAAIWTLGRIDPANFGVNPEPEREEVREPDREGMALLSARLDQILRRRQSVIDVIAVDVD